MKKRISRRSFLTISAMTAASVALDMNKIAAYAKSMGPMRDYPTVIIGAGLGGLCCGAGLARQGIPVTVVEQHDIPGGYATTFDRAAGKFTFEVSLHGASIHNNKTSDVLKNLGVLDKLELVELPEVYRLKSPGLDITVPQRDPGAYIRLLAERFPDEADGIRGFVREMLGIADEVADFDKKGKWAKTLSKVIFPIRYGKMWAVRNKTLADLLDDHVKAPAVREALAGLWGYYGLPPSKLSGFYYANATGGYLKNGSYYIKDGSQSLSNALVEVIEEAGGRILYDSPAEKIEMEKGAVKGVTLAGGETLPARAVVSNASVPATFNKLLPRGAAPADYLKKLKGYRPSLSSFIVWLGLNRELGKEVDFYSTHVSSGRGPEADYQSCLKGEIDKGGFAVTVYDALHKGHSRPGTATLMIVALAGYEPWRPFEADYRAGRKEAYNRQKNQWADILIRRAEQMVIPGLSSMIEVREAATPLTNWSYTGNPEGAIYGFEQSMDNAYMNRIENRTPVKGLYLAGAWGSPGGGYVGVLRSGEKTFRMMMEDWGGG